MFRPRFGSLAYGSSFIGAAMGLALLQAGSITEMQFSSLPRGRKGKQPKVRSRYTPAGPHRNCGHYGISPKGLRRGA